MTHLELLGYDLKSDFLNDLFETYDVQVVYRYDRTHEGIADEYLAEIQELGLEFIFDERHVLTTLFWKQVEVTTFNPFEADPSMPAFLAKEEATRYARDNGLKTTEGTAEFSGEQKVWIRIERDTHSIHYEYIDADLRMITLQRTDA